MSATLGPQVAGRLGLLGLISERDRERVARELDVEFDKILIPDLDTTIRMVAAHMHGQGRFYIEIAVDPVTKQVGWTFEPADYPDRGN